MKDKNCPKEKAKRHTRSTDSDRKFRSEQILHHVQRQPEQIEQTKEVQRKKNSEEIT